MNLEWMAWTTPTAVFFSTIVLILIGMTIWEIYSPTIKRKGFLPIATTRGDRLFIGLLSSAYMDRLNSDYLMVSSGDQCGLAGCGNALGITLWNRPA